MTEQKFLDILERGGLVWRGRYHLYYLEQNSRNPDLEWQGYVIDEINSRGYHTIFKTQKISELLDTLNELIDKEVELKYNVSRKTS